MQERSCCAYGLVLDICVKGKKAPKKKGTARGQRYDAARNCVVICYIYYVLRVSSVWMCTRAEMCVVLLLDVYSPIVLCLANMYAMKIHEELEFSFLLEVRALSRMASCCCSGTSYGRRSIAMFLHFCFNISCEKEVAYFPALICWGEKTYAAES